MTAPPHQPTTESRTCRKAALFNNAMKTTRAQAAYNTRVAAAELARTRVHQDHKANPDEQRYASSHYPMSFTKGLDHDLDLGTVADPLHFEAFRTAIDEGFIEPFTTRVPVPQDTSDKGLERRCWEAPTAGLVFDLQGPDAQAVTMPPAPELGSDELAFEMAEVYELSLLRDVPLHCFDQNGGSGSAKITVALKRLSKMKYAQSGFPGRPRTTDGEGELTRQNIFRGSSPGVDVGPYLSQFLLIGNEDQAGAGGPTSGDIVFGAQTISQKVLQAVDQDDYMKRWTDWHEVQQGFNVNKEKGSKTPSGQNFGSAPKRRFIYTPRDLATYVHFDALYQAYLNGALILLGMKAPFDPAFDKLAGMNGKLLTPLIPGQTTHPLNAGGFALYGGPHILTLVTEVATRALKAVRFQKFNNHLRLRPEALAARVCKWSELDQLPNAIPGLFESLKESMDRTLVAIDAENPDDSLLPNGNFLLPMAFAEGSPSSLFKKSGMARCFPCKDWQGARRKLIEISDRRATKPAFSWVAARRVIF